MHSPYPLHNDEPAEQDGLERGSLCGQIAEAAANAPPPLVLGVHGDWGQGKTSFLRHVRQALQQGEQRQRIVTVWFDAWRYQNEAAPVVALLQEIRRQFAKSEQFQQHAKKIGAVTARALLNSIGDLAKLIKLESLPLSAEKIQALGEQWEKEHLENQLLVDSLQQHLQQAIDTLLPKAVKGAPTPRIVIFIDDLDRCNPDMAYRLLEGLKIYLNLNNCVFVLAMNQQVITEAIAQAMKKEDHDPRVKLRAEAYLEKLCANIWRLPPPVDPAAFFAGLLAADEPKQAIKQAAERLKTSFLPPNPRRLKSLANLYNRLWTEVDRGLLRLDYGDDELALHLLVVAYVYQFHSELYQRWRHDSLFFETLQEWVRGEEPQIGAASFDGLVLPTRMEFTADSGQAVPEAPIKGNYPDPYAPGIFWVAPLLQTALTSSKHVDYHELLKLESA